MRAQQHRLTPITRYEKSRRMLDLQSAAQKMRSILVRLHDLHRLRHSVPPWERQARLDGWWQKAE